MAIIKDTLVDLVGEPDWAADAYAELWSAVDLRDVEGDTATNKRVRIPITAEGLETEQVAAGPALIRLYLGALREPLGPYEIMVPEGSAEQRLLPLILAGRPPMGTPVSFLKVPAGGVDGQVLGLVGGQLAWVNGGAVDVDGPLAQASSAYRTAALAAGSSRLRLAALGDSSWDGYGNPGGPDIWAKTAPINLAELLRTDLGLAVGGRGWIPPSTPLAPGNYEYVPAALLPNGYALDDLTTQVGIPGSLWLQRGHASNVDEVTYTLSVGTTAVDIVTTGYGGNMTFTPASGSPVTIDSTGDRVITRITNPGATVNIHAASGVGIALLGIVEHVGDQAAGVTMWNLARGAMAAHEFAAWLADGDKSLKPMIGTYAPHVLFVGLGANDYQNGRTPTELGTALTAIHTQVTAVSAATELVYVIRSLPDDPEQATTWTIYAETITSTAAAVGAHVLDLRPSVPNGTSGLYLLDGVHYTEAGNLAVAQAIAEYMHVAV